MKILKNSIRIGSKEMNQILFKMKTGLDSAKDLDLVQVKLQTRSRLDLDCI